MLNFNVPVTKSALTEPQWKVSKNFNWTILLHGELSILYVFRFWCMTVMDRA